jgi:hypothetical protein
VFGAGSTPQERAEAARRTVSGFQTTQHMITNHVITIDGDKALCVAYLQAQHCLPNEQGDSTQTIGGYYTNHFIRTPHGWKIKACKLTMTWSKGNWGIFELARQRLFRKVAARFAELSVAELARRGWRDRRR